MDDLDKYRVVFADRREPARCWHMILATFSVSFLRHGKSIDPMFRQDNAGAGVVPAPALIGLDEFQLANPRRGGLHQSPPPLHQPGQHALHSVCRSSILAASGELSLNCLSHLRGQAQFQSTANLELRE